MSSDSIQAPEADPQGSRKLSEGGITLVVPAYNEERGIAGVVERLHAIDLGVPFQLLVVNDGSDDGTGAELERLKQRFPKLRVVDHPRNRGYGAALKTGFSKATTPIVVITDADGTYPEDRIADLVECIDQGAEMAVGSRTGADVHIPLIRRPAKWALRQLASFLAETKIPDLNSGLRAFRRELVMKYLPILPEGFSFTTTITLASLTNRHAVDYVTINYAQREGSSKIKPIRDTLRFIGLIVRTVLYFNPLKVFYPLAILLGLAVGTSLIYDMVYTTPPNLGDKTVLLFVAAVQVLTVGLLADLIVKQAKLR